MFMLIYFHSATDLDLSDMSYTDGAHFDSEKGCLPGTCGGIIGEITQWVNSPNGDNVSHIFFLSGVARSGKSAITHTIIQLFYQRKQVGSSYCFDHSGQVNSRPSNLFSTTALNLADLDHQGETLLNSIAKGNCSLQMTFSAAEQFKVLYLSP